MLQDLLGIFVQAAFIENLALAYFLGLCSFIAVSSRVETAVGLGLAVIFVMGITSPMNWAIHAHVLAPGALGDLHPALADLDLSFLTYLAFIASIAAMVQIVEMVTDRFSPRLHATLGVFLPLIAVNCAILGVSLFLVEREYDLVQSTAFGLGSGVGWALAVIALAAIRERLRYSNIPAGLQGAGIAFIITGLMAMAFMAFAGVRL